MPSSHRAEVLKLELNKARWRLIKTCSTDPTPRVSDSEDLVRTQIICLSEFPGDGDAAGHTLRTTVRPLSQSLGGGMPMTLGQCITSFNNKRTNIWDNYLEKLRRTTKTSGEQEKKLLHKVYSPTKDHAHGFEFIFSVSILTSKVCFSSPLNIVEWTYYLDCWFFS